MPLPIHVDEYSGHRANQRPRSFTVDEQVFNIEAVLDQWYQPSGTYFKVRTNKTDRAGVGGKPDKWDCLHRRSVQGLNTFAAIFEVPCLPRLTILRPTDGKTSKTPDSFPASFTP